MLGWDVSNGVRVWTEMQQLHICTQTTDGCWLAVACFFVLQVARRCWSGNSNAYETIQHTMEENRQLRVTMPFPVQDECVLDRALQG